MKIVVYENLHRTGQDSEHTTGKGETLLLNSAGYSCCIGFATIQAGVNPVKCRGRGTPAAIVLFKKDLDIRDTLITAGLCTIRGDQSSDFVNEAISINDSRTTTYAQKKKLLRSLAKQYGHTFVFRKVAPLTWRKRVSEYSWSSILCS